MVPKAKSPLLELPPQHRVHSATAIPEARLDDEQIDYHTLYYENLAEAERLKQGTGWNYWTNDI
eukprot:3862658-Amphidinium_carterae.1